MLFNKSCSVNKKDDSMRKLAVMSGLGVLDQRVRLAAAIFCFICLTHKKSFKCNKIIRIKRLLLKGTTGVACD